MLTILELIHITKANASQNIQSIIFFISFGKVYLTNSLQLF